MNRLSWKVWAGGACAMALLAGGGAWWWTQGRAPDVVYRTGKIERGPLQATVSASGAVNPVTQVSVGTQVSGQIKELYADFNSEVKAGQLIAQIDPETFEYRVRQAQADVDSAQAAVLTAQANAAASRAAVSRAQVDLNEANRDYERKKMLVDKQFIAQSEADKARALVNTTIEALKSAEAQLNVTSAQIKSALASVAQRQAALAQARVDLGRTRILSPVNGIVIKRAIEKGQTVAASLQSPELFVIAQNLRDMQVDASIDESDVGRIRTGQRATFTVDAFPGQTFEGEIRQVRKAAQNVANVVTYVAVVGFSNTGGRLLPGMTANVRVVTESRESVLKFPNAALRVRIAGVEPATAPAAAPGAAPGARPASANGTTGDASGWSWLPQAQAQPSGERGGALAAAKKTVRPEPVEGSGRAQAEQAGAQSQRPAARVEAGAGSPGAGGSATEFRARLISELQLTPSQLEKVDAIYADARPKFMQLRELPQEERGKARERIAADVRARIGDLLTPEQKPRYAAMQAEAAGRTVTRGRIYLLDEDGKPKAFNVRLGITDGTSTELVVAPNSPEAGEMKEGALVITGVSTPGAPAAGARPSGPRMPF
jgi:HlyD family secretion protein